MKKPVYSFRLDKDTVEKAQASGIDLPRFIEVTLQEQLKLNKCRLCGAVQRGKK